MKTKNKRKTAEALFFEFMWLASESLEDRIKDQPKLLSAIKLPRADFNISRSFQMDNQKHWTDLK